MGPAGVQCDELRRREPTVGQVVALALIDGSLDYWTGPISDNQGNEVVAEGATLAIDDINGMDWLIEGVVGEVPK